MKQESGFTLIEIVASLVIVGIMAVFASMFMVVGLQGYELTRKAAAAAMDAEVALQRISLELRNISSITAAPDASTLEYTSSDNTLPGDRALKIESGNIYLTAGGSDYLLMKDVTDATLEVGYFTGDLDGDTNGDEEVAFIAVTFTLGDMPEFKVQVYPREMINRTW